MDPNGLSAALLDTLGRETTVALLDVIETKHMQWSERVLSLTIERFERRLSEEMSRFRVDMIREIHEVRSDVVRWMFAFWVGQFFAVAGLVAALVAFMSRFKAP